MLPLNGSREGLFSAIFPALARKPKMERPAVLIPNPFYQAYAAAAAASGAAPDFLPSTAETGFLPELEAIDEALLAADRRLLSLHAVESARRRGRPRLSRPRHRARAALRLSPVRRRMLFGDLWRHAAARRARDGLRRDREPRQCRGVPVAVQALGAAGLKVGLRRRRSRVHRGLRPLPQRRLPASAASRAACLGRGLGATRSMWSRDGRSTGENFAMRRRLPGGRYGYRRPRGASFFGSNMAAFGGGERPRKPFGKGVVSECCRELISHKPNPMASIRARTTSGSRSCMTRTPPARP